MKNLPVEIISFIMKKCNLRTRAQFLLVNRELHNEVKRHLIPEVTRMDGGGRKETFHDEGNRKVTIIYMKNGEGKEYKWRVIHFKNKNHFHREDGPALTEWFDNGVKHIEQWYKNNVLHRKEKTGIANAEWNREGKIVRQEWYENGTLLREWEIKYS